MKFLLKNTLNSLRKNKGQVFVIMITIILVTMLSFVSFSMSDIFTQTLKIEYDRIANGADMLVGTHIPEIDMFYSRAKINNLLDFNDVEDIMYFTRFGTVLKTEKSNYTILLEATDLEEYLTKNNVRFIASYKPKPEELGYPLFIIDPILAEKADLKAGDLVEIYNPIMSSYIKMRVGHIAYKEGIFASAVGRNILLDFSAIENIGQINSTYINFKKDSDFQKYEKIFLDNLPNIRISEGDSRSRVKVWVANNLSVLGVAMGCILLLMSIILLSTYNIVIKHKEKEMITLKSLGTSPKQIVIMLLLEVFIYAFVGITIGMLLGQIIFSGILKVVSPVIFNGISFPMWKYIATVGLTLGLTILTVIVPIIKMSKKTMVELNQENIKIAKLTNPIYLIISIALVIVLMIVYFFIPEGVAKMVISFAIVPLTILIIIFSSGYLYNLFSHSIRDTSFGIAGYSSIRNGNIKRLATILAIIIVFVVFIVDAVDLVKIITKPELDRFNADYIIIATKPRENETYQDFVNELNLMNGVEQATYFNETRWFYSTLDFKDPSGNMALYGISDKKMLRISTERLSESAYKDWDLYDNAIVLSEDVALRLNKKIGDEVVFIPAVKEFESKMTFKIVGIDKKLTVHDEKAYVKYKMVSHHKEGVNYLIVSDRDIFLDLRDKVESSSIENAYLLPYEEWAKQDNGVGEELNYILYLLQILVYSVALVGILNLAIMSIHSRQNELDIYKMSGMGNKDFKNLVLGESFIITSTGSLLGIFGGLLVNFAIPGVYQLVDHYISFNIAPANIFIVSILASVVFIISWVFISFYIRRKRVISINSRLNS